MSIQTSVVVSFSVVGDGSTSAFTVDPTQQISAALGNDLSAPISSATYLGGSSTVPGSVTVNGASQLNITTTNPIANGVSATIVIQALVTPSGRAGDFFIDGGLFHTTQPTVPDGGSSGLQITSRGALIVATGVDVLSVKEPKDTARNPITIYLDRVAGVTAEALSTLNIVKGFATATTGTSYTVTAGKTFRIQSVVVTILDNATINFGRLRVRAVSSGSVIATSPIIIDVDVPASPGTAVAGAGNSVTFSIPDGYELPAGAQLGITHLEAATTTLVSACLVGYEY